MARHSYNKLKLIGTLVENNTKVELKGGSCVLMGNIVVRAKDTDFTINVFKSEKFGTGKENESYTKMTEWLDDAIPESKSVEDASRLSISVEMTENRYINKENKLANAVKFTIPMFNYPLSSSEEDLAEGMIEGFVNNIKPEIVNDEETGRSILSLYCVGYDKEFSDKANELTFIIPEELVADVENEYSRGDTISISYEINTTGVVKEVSTGSGFGRSAKISKTFARPEYVLIGGKSAYNEEMVNKKGEKLKYSKEEMTQLVKERKIIEEVIVKEGYKGNGNSNNTSKTKKPTTSKPKDNFVAMDDDDDDDIPF